MGGLRPSSTQPAPSHTGRCMAGPLCPLPPAPPRAQPRPSTSAATKRGCPSLLTALLPLPALPSPSTHLPSLHSLLSTVLPSPAPLHPHPILLPAPSQLTAPHPFHATGTGYVPAVPLRPPPTSPRAADRAGVESRPSPPRSLRETSRSSKTTPHHILSNALKQTLFLKTPSAGHLQPFC